MGTPAGKSNLKTLTDGATATSSYVQSSYIITDTARVVNCILSFTSAATGNQLSIVPIGSMQGEGDASKTWYAIACTDGTLTEVDLSNLPAALNITGKNFSSATVKGTEVRTAAADGTSEKVNLAIPFNVGPFRLMSFLVKQLDGGTAPTYSILANTSE